MAALTATSVVTESIGSMQLQIVTFTIGATTSDTYTIQAYAPVVDCWTQSQVGSAGYSKDVTWTPATGIFLLTGASHTGTNKLFILLRS